MKEIDLLRKDISDYLIQIRANSPDATVVDGLLVNARLTLEEYEEIEKKLARLTELEGE